MRKITIILDNGAGELDRTTISVKEPSGNNESAAIIEALSKWTLSPGDTIKIIDAGE